MTYMLNMHSPRMHQEWGMTKRLDSIKTAIRYLREGRGRSASVHLNKRVVWQRSSVQIVSRQNT